MTDEILFETRGAVGIVELNRPAALNAQNLVMVRAFTAQLTIWENDPAITTLFLHGAGDRAFCAGGDIRALWGHSAAEQWDFFEIEYDLCARLRATRLTLVAYMDGVTMGGGVGLSMFADIRLATPKTLWAMPEVKIGFFPDIAATWFLPRLSAGPGFGRYLGLTGARLNGADCLAAGIATHYVETGIDKQLIDRITSRGVEDIAALCITPAETSAVPDLAAELNALANVPLADCWADLQRRDLWPDDSCALSVGVTDAAMTIASRLSYAETVVMDKRLVRHFLAGKTFPEGVRTRLIDRGQAPDWPDQQPEASEIIGYFADVTK